MARSLKEWTELLRTDTGPKGFSDMPEAMLACNDMDERVAFLRAFRDAVARKHPEMVAISTIADNFDFIASEYDLPPRPWAKAIELAFPVRFPSAEEIAAGANWGKGGFGQRIPDIVARMTAEANASGKQLRCQLNDVFYIANPGDTADDVYAHAAVGSMIYRLKLHFRRRIARQVSSFVEGILERLDKNA